MKLNLIILTTFAAATTTVHAQSFGIVWFTLDGGGGVSAGGTFAVSGTVGQPDAGAMSGSDYRLASVIADLHAVEQQASGGEEVCPPMIQAGRQSTSS